MSAHRLLDANPIAEVTMAGSVLPIHEAQPLDRGGLGSRSLRGNLAWTSLGTIVYSACQWLILVVLAKAGSPETVGQFSLGLAITAPVMMFASLNLRAVQATDAHRQFPFSVYFGVRSLTTAAALIVITGVALIGQYGDETRLVILALALAKAIDAISDVYYGDLQQRETMSRIGISQVIRGITSVSLVGLVMIATGSIALACLAMALGSAAILVCYDRNGRSHDTSSVISSRPRRSDLRQLSLTAAPLGIVLLLISLDANIPRYFIQGEFGEHELGIFSAMAYITVGAGLVSNSLGQVASPRLARQYIAGDYAAFRALTGRLLGLTAVGSGLLVLAVLLAGPTILTLLYTAEYAEASDVFLWLAVGTALQLPTSILGYALTAAQRRAIQAPLFVLLTVVLIAACALLVPAYGLVGAAVAMAIANGVQLLGIGVLLWSAVGKPAQTAEIMEEVA